MIGDNGRLQYLRLCLFAIYVNVVFVIRCYYSAASLTLVREQHFIIIIKIDAFKKQGDDLEKKKKKKEREREEIECTGKVEIGTRKKFLAVGEACEAIFRPIPDFNGRMFVSSLFSTEWILISAAAVAHCGRTI